MDDSSKDRGLVRAGDTEFLASEPHTSSITTDATDGSLSLHRSLGLTDEEMQEVRRILGREPNHLELSLYAVMWSEHCSYKSSRLHLRRLPTKGERVLVGPGENAGVIDAGDGIALAVRIESHNHPSAIEPYQGAATGVGGILRDIFTMGARPLAILDPLFFGDLDSAHQRWIFEGVVSGISGYGNSVGVPTVGGELTFDPSYAQNPLVNVLCLGALPKERLVLGIASGPGNLAVLLGSSTGRDGIGGVSVLASAGFSGAEPEPSVEPGANLGAEPEPRVEPEQGAEPEPGVEPEPSAEPEQGVAITNDSKRPSVQVGDPFEEKRLIEACLELLDRKLVVGIQDLGGAGLACATSETAGRGGVGMDVDVSAVPRRADGMEPWEVMTSESQERMLAIITPDAWPSVAEVCGKWEVNAAVIGKVTPPEQQPESGSPNLVGRLRIRDGFDGPILADVPAASLSDDAPLYHRPLLEPKNRDERAQDDPILLPPPTDCGSDLLALLADTSWVYSQYDHQLFLNTIEGPGADAALLKIAGPGLPPSKRGVGVCTDSNPRWCSIDPRLGTEMLVAEGIANLACVGTTPVAVVNCLNFGNPEHPEVMWQLSEAIDGMSQACNEFGLAVVGGNVSFYNESAGVDIDPTPVIGLLGLLESLEQRPPGLGWNDGDTLILLGSRQAPIGVPSLCGPYPLGGSRWAVECRGHRSGTLLGLDYEAHTLVTRLVAGLVSEAVAGRDALLTGVHDLSTGGLAMALAKMALAKMPLAKMAQGKGAPNIGVGCEVDGVDGYAELFCELPSRFLVSSARPQEVLDHARSKGVSATVLGLATGDRLVVKGLIDLDMQTIHSVWTQALPQALARLD